MKISGWVFSGFFLVLTACAAQPILKMEKLAVPKGKSTSEIQKAIRVAAVGLGWSVKKEDKGLTELALFVRTHIARVTVVYDQKSYTIRYKDSSNLDYNAAEGTIHRNYNRWIRNLSMKIQQQL